MTARGRRAFVKILGLAGWALVFPCYGEGFHLIDQEALLSRGKTLWRSEGNGGGNGLACSALAVIAPGLVQPGGEIPSTVLPLLYLAVEREIRRRNLPLLAGVHGPPLPPPEQCDGPTAATPARSADRTRCSTCHVGDDKVGFMKFAFDPEDRDAWVQNLANASTRASTRRFLSRVLGRLRGRGHAPGGSPVS